MLWKPFHNNSNKHNHNNSNSNNVDYNNNNVTAPAGMPSLPSHPPRSPGSRTCVNKVKRNNSWQAKSSDHWLYG